MIPVPTVGRVTVEPIFRLQAETEALKKNAAGLIIPEIKGDGKTKFDGIPNQGIIKALPADYSGPLQLQDHIVFNEPKPYGLNIDGEKYFILDEKKIDAVL